MSRVAGMECQVNVEPVSGFLTFYHEYKISFSKGHFVWFHGAERRLFAGLASSSRCWK